MKYVDDVEPGEFVPADLVNLVASLVNNQPGKARDIAKACPD